MRSLHTVGNWAIDQKTTRGKTTHWWWHDLSVEAVDAFRQVAVSPAVTSLFEPLFPPASHDVRPLEEMNELYVAAASSSLSSDNVFHLNHVDGPFGVFPLVHVYRVMCACTPNHEIELIFPMEGDDSRCTLTTGELAGFDFHRELHRIGRVPGAASNPSARVCLKLHYAVYPKALRPLGCLLGRLTTSYNRAFRTLFLSTIAPGSATARMGAFAVVAGTYLFNNIEAFLGWGNINILSMILLASKLASSANIFFYGTSFVHYIVYISTYACRQPCSTSIAFGAFKRDVLLFKSLALAQAAAQYVSLEPRTLPDQLHWLSCVLLLGGFGLAALASAALGVDRTYFGWELGQIKANHVQRFPYGTIPHPMILGGMTGWLGFHALPAFRHAHPYYAPLHVALYALHACQEHASIHANGRLARCAESSKDAPSHTPVMVTGSKPRGREVGEKMALWMRFIYTASCFLFLAPAGILLATAFSTNDAELRVLCSAGAALVLLQTGFAYMGDVYEFLSRGSNGPWGTADRTCCLLNLAGGTYFVMRVSSKALLLAAAGWTALALALMGGTTWTAGAMLTRTSGPWGSAERPHLWAWCHTMWHVLGASAGVVLTSSVLAVALKADTCSAPAN